MICWQDVWRFSRYFCCFQGKPGSGSREGECGWIYCSFLTGCLGLAETIDLFCGKDFLIFISDSIDPKKYNLKKVYAVEKWLFAIDTLSLFGMAFHLGGGTGDLVLAAVVLVTLFAHVYVFKSRNFRV